MNKFLSLAMILVLAACSGSDGVPAEGEYQQTVKVVDLDYPNITAEERVETIKQMEKVAGGPTGGRFCMTGDESGAQWKEAAAEMANSLGGMCETMSDKGTATRIALDMACVGTDKGDVEIKMTGRSQADGYESNMKFDFRDPGSDATAKLEMDVTAERIGDCATQS